VLLLRDRGARRINAYLLGAIKLKHDFSKQPDGTEANEFISWLLSETVKALIKDYGNAETTKTSIFLYVNRAFESKMPEKQIAEIFAKAVVAVGYCEKEQEVLFAWLEYFGEIARGVHSGT
jgi:hypothetical protein